MNERRLLFEQQAQAQAASVAANRTNSVGARASVVAAGTDDGGKARLLPLQRAMSLKERMLLLQGWGAGGDGAGGGRTAESTTPSPVSNAPHPGKTPPAAPAAGGDTNSASVAASKLVSPADAGVGQAKVGGLQDRLKAFGGGAECQGKPEAAKLSTAKPAMQQQQQQVTTQALKPQSMSERMAAWQCGEVGGASSAVSGAQPAVGKLKSTGNFPNTESSEAANAAVPAAPVVPHSADSAMSLKERLALLQQDKREDTQPDAIRKIDIMNFSNTNRSGQENLPSNAPNNVAQMSQLRNNANFRHSSGSMGSSGGSQEESREGTSNDSSGNVPKNTRTANGGSVHARWEGSGLSQQARDVAAALGGLQDEEEEEEEEAAAGELQVKSVFGRVSMFETGDMAAGWDAERTEPGRLPGQSKKEEKVDQTSMDVNDIKNRWKTGNVQAEDKCVYVRVCLFPSVRLSAQLCSSHM